MLRAVAMLRAGRARQVHARLRLRARHRLHDRGRRHLVGAGRAHRLLALARVGLIDGSGFRLRTGSSMRPARISASALFAHCVAVLVPTTRETAAQAPRPCSPTAALSRTTSSWLHGLDFPLRLPPGFSMRPRGSLRWPSPRGLLRGCCAAGRNRAGMRARAAAAGNRCLRLDARAAAAARAAGGPELAAAARELLESCSSCREKCRSTPSGAPRSTALCPVRAARAAR